MTPVDLLERNVVLTIGDVARVLNLLDGHGRPRRDVVHKLIRDESLRLVDPNQPITRWTVAVAEVRRYIDGGVTPGRADRAVPHRPLPARAGRSGDAHRRKETT